VMNKYGAALGAGVMTMYRVILISLIAFVVLGLSAVFYPHYIDVMDSEAEIMARGVVECLSGEGVVSLDDYSEGDFGQVLEFCGFSNAERLYVKAEVKRDGGVLKTFSQGDSGKKWIRDFVEANKGRVGAEAVKTRPGYFVGEFPVTIYPGEEGSIGVEVLVNNG